MVRVQISTSPKLPAQSNIAVFVFEKSLEILSSPVPPGKIKKFLKEAESDGFEGKENQFSLVHGRQRNFNRIFFIGLGPKNEINLETARRAAAQAIRQGEKLKIKELFIKPPILEKEGVSTSAQAATEGAILGSYKYLDYKTKENKNHLKTLFLVASSPKEKGDFGKGLRMGTILSQSTIFARDLINKNPSDTTPEEMAKVAKSLAHGSITVKIFDKEQIAKMGMGGLLGVNRGSGKPPVFVHLIYKPEGGKAARKIGIIGKGITFDSGGLSLKPSKAMEDMKMDMSGAAAVMGIFKALSELKPANLEVHGFAPLTENMPGENALKPGDVVKTYGGKTVEVLNTDAEGRLILADALGYASEQKLDEIIDLATLTGACIIALGNDISGLMSNDAELTEKIKKASRLSGEKVWELPLEKEYRTHMDSQIADIKNIGKSGHAGTIIGGLFLKEFVDGKIPWAHIDIAGSAWAENQNALSASGGTGVMVRTLLLHILGSSLPYPLSPTPVGVGDRG